MIYKVVELLTPIIDKLVFAYSLALIVSYILMGILATYALMRYINHNRSADYNTIFHSDSLVPGISIIASCYNESAVVADCVRSLLNLHYPDYEVIVVNDGSKDNTLEILCKEFSLEKSDYYVDMKLSTQVVRGVYKSKNKAFHNLLVLDKENGGKSDAMNAGYNVASKLYTVSIDVDSILASDALLKLVKPITESAAMAVVSVGGAVHVANGCRFNRGVLTERRVPKGYNTRMQVVEYLRAFLIGRMAFGQINGLFLVSGALGIFRKDLVLEIGGYRTDCIGEDMELTIRLRKYLYERKLPHKVVYIPEPLLWTEVPPTLKVMERQRTRWTRGLIDSLRLHKNVFFNPRYGVMGLVTYPYFVFFEWLAPFVEVSGLMFVILLITLGMIKWKIFLFLFLFMYLFGISYSFFSIFLGEMTYHVYDKKRDLWKLFFVSLTEIMFYHPLLVYWSLKGNWMFLRGKKSWGEMTRRGFGSSNN
ncbi:glycosyltransferase [uncultured Parabacteroides sp.]|uniref:glycosyltransferase family 2 protein n=1 Tax=uncultured Parabacteroides sp. TaxID=512312 RepID=UPI0025E7043C|nr:glycosyltransferase [uncultured Parabacteroides sp.]